MNALQSSLSRRCLAAWVALTLACGLFASRAPAQPPAGARESRPADPKSQPAADLKVIPLKHAAAQQVIQQLANLDPDLMHRARLVAQGNRLLIFTTPEDFAQIKRWIETLDTAGTAAETTKPLFFVFHLKGIVPDKALSEALSMLVGSAGAFVVDQERRSVVVSANQSTLDKVAAFLSKLEDQQTTTLPKLRVRIVWLASGLTRKDALDLPRDMKGVSEELASLGITGLRLVSQSVVDVTARAPFSSEGVAQLDSPCDLSIQGMVLEQSRGDSPKMQLSIKAKLTTSATPLCQLSTEMVTPPGHFVVLGVTPTEASTSVFVVQLLLPK